MVTNNGTGVSDDVAKTSAESFAPLITAMTLEGNYNMKPPCYDSPIINVPEPNCTTGAPWNSEHAQSTMAGNLNGPTVSESDNFHRVDSVTPVHLPYFKNTCAYGDSSCVLDSVSVT